MRKRKTAIRTFNLGSRLVELTRDRIRIVDSDGKILGVWTTHGPILRKLCTCRAGTVAIPTGNTYLYRVVETEDRPASIRLWAKPVKLWVRRGRILVAARDRLTLYGVRPLRDTLRVRTRGSIDTSLTVISYPFAAVKSHRQAHVLNLSSARALLVEATGAISKLAIRNGVVIILERDRISLVDGKELKRTRKLNVSQKLLPATLRVGTGLAAVATRDTVVVANLEKHRLKQVQLSGRVDSVRLSGRVVVVKTRVQTVRLDPDGNRI